jgi:NADH-quinone oxidoreductase subunit E
VLAGFNDGRGQEGIAAGPASLVGLEIARRRGDKAPAYPGAATDGQEG